MTSVHGPGHGGSTTSLDIMNAIVLKNSYRNEHPSGSIDNAGQ